MEEVNAITCDWLGFTLDEWKDWEKEEVLDNMRLARKVYKGKLFKYADLYEWQLVVNIGNSVYPKQVISVSLKPPKKSKKAGYTAVRFNPSKLDQTGWDRALGVLGIVLGLPPKYAWEVVRYAGKLTRFDVALDLKGYAYKDLVLWLPYLKSTSFAETHEVLKLGGSSSAAQLIAYDKSWEMAGKNIFIEESIYRLELRLRKLAQSLHDLKPLSNPFEEVIVADTNKAYAAANGKAWEQFVDQARLGGPAMKAALDGLHPQTRKSYLQRLKSCRPDSLSGNYWSDLWPDAFARVWDRVPAIGPQEYAPNAFHNFFTFSFGGVEATKWKPT